LSDRHQTQMAHANNKDLHDYLRLKTTKAFIQELSLETGIHGSKIIQVRKGRGDRTAAKLLGGLGICLQHLVRLRLRASHYQYSDDARPTGMVSRNCPHY
jgi:KilA-N domain